MENDLEILTLKGHERGVSSVAFSPDARRIVSGSEDSTAKVWEVDSNGDLLTLEGSQDYAERRRQFFETAGPGGQLGLTISAIAFSPDGSRFLNVTSSPKPQFVEATVREAHTGRPLRSFPGVYRAGSFFPDGRRLAALRGQAQGPCDLVVLDVETGDGSLSIATPDNKRRRPAVSRDGRRIFTSVANRSTNRDEIQTWDVESSRLLSSLKLPGATHDFALSLDDRRIATIGDDGKLRIWETEGGRELLTIQDDIGVRRIACSADGRRLATGGVDTMLRIWDTETGRQLAVCTGHNRTISCLAFSPDGRRVASGDHDGVIKLWEAEGGREVLALKRQLDDVESLAFSPDGRRLVSGGILNLLAVWRTAEPDEVARWEREERGAP